LDIRPFFNKPPVLTQRQRLLYGLDRYPSKPAAEKLIEVSHDSVSKEAVEETSNADSAGREDAPASSKGRLNRWGRPKAMAGTAITDASKTSGDTLPDSDNEGFWNTSSNETKKPQHAIENPCADNSSEMETKDADLKNEKEVRKLKKALKEIGNLEVQQQILGNGVGKLRQNQLQKMAKKQEYIARLQDLTGSSTEDSEA